MGAGKYNKKITFQKVSKVRDPDSLEYVNDWVDYKRVWASIKPLNGRELFQAQQVKTEISHRIETRYFSDIDASMRIVKDGRFFEVESFFNVDEANKELQFICSEKVK